MENEKVPTPLPIGISYFDILIDTGYYYVDKTLFIKSLLDSPSAVTLCTRPRRFGKTLNQTMLKSFFEDTKHFGGRDTSELFQGLKIESAGEQYMRHQGKYPVIFLSLKETKRDSFEISYTELIRKIAGEFYRHRYIIETLKDKLKYDLYERLMFEKGSISEYSTSIEFLSQCLEDYYGQKVVILIDEYDVPLENAWFNGFYDRMINIVRPLLSSSLKDNPSLKFAVITGCLRISRESIFTGLNNLDVISILSVKHSEFFGFTQSECDIMLDHYDLSCKRELLKEWYDGYLFGNTEVYNPWSTIKMVSDWLSYIDFIPRPYWVNTSGNDIVRTIIDQADDEAKKDLNTLMTGGVISKYIHEDISFADIYKKPDNVWNFLLFTGYLRVVRLKTDHIEKIIAELTIPNKEVNIIYSDKIQDWFRENYTEKNLDSFYKAILEGDVETFQIELEQMLRESISFLDSAENFYHGFMVGVLNRLKGFYVKSNRETGDGRNDLALCSNRAKVVIFELKVAKELKDLQNQADIAAKQIIEKNYSLEYEDEGYTDIMKYGVAFYKKRCKASFVMDNGKEIGIR